MDPIVLDAATATSALNKIRDDLTTADADLGRANTVLRDLIVTIRPTGILTVDHMAHVIGRERNYIDSVWSVHGSTAKGKQTRVPAVADGDLIDRTAKSLSDAAASQSGAVAKARTLRAERDRIVTMVYASKILGPTAIAAAVGVDRNHVLRIARKQGASPAHRVNSRNQYSH